METTPKPLLAITLGDPTGIGPEIVAKAWREPRLRQDCLPVVVGRPEILERVLRELGLPLGVVSLTAGLGARVGELREQIAALAYEDRGLNEESVSPNSLKATAQSIPCIVAGSAELAKAPCGRHHPFGGQAAYEALRTATQLALARQVDGIVTAPLSKTALHMAGHFYPGHTELLAEWCGVQNFAMMLYLPPGLPLRGETGLGVAHVTLHTGMRRIWDEITTEHIVEKGELLWNMLRRLGDDRPKLAIAALNPHAGEDGLFGDEEARLIGPAAAQLAARGLDVKGPLPVDTLMVRARNGEFSGVVAMYHDQGHIALKLLGMERAVNVTLGLPIVRTSVAHGTAHDIAGQGIAQHGSLLEAVSVAAKLAAARDR